MLIIPYHTRFAARALPVVTLLLIALNFAVFFGPQARDAGHLEAAAGYYFSSSLPAKELPRYLNWLQDRNDAAAQRTLRLAQSLREQATPWPLVDAMQRDEGFQRALAEGRIVTPADPGHARWQAERAHFASLLDSVFTDRNALSPGHFAPLQLLTYQFLHADLAHLLGNMLVLLLAGPFAEAALGRLRFALAYLASGVGAGLLHLAVGNGALIGASGAVSGAMAMVAVLYGMRRVPVFYTVLFWFDTARVPALALLPLWLAIEAVQWIVAPGGRIAYWAHLGGFASGAVLAWLLRSPDRGKVDRILADNEGTARAHSSTLLAEAQQAAARLDTARAARAYRGLLEDEPDHVAHATAYFNMALLGRDRDVLADAALRVLWIRRAGARNELRRIYLQMSQPHVLGVLAVDEQLRLARRLVATREDAAALRVLDTLLAQAETRSTYGRQLADALLGLFTTYTRHGMKAQADQVKARLTEFFPNPDALGGLAPSSEPPPTIRATTRLDPRATTRSAGRALDLDLDIDTRGRAPR